MQLRSKAIKRFTRWVLVLAIVLALKPPYPHTDAQSSVTQNINNQGQVVSQEKAQPVVEKEQPKPAAPAPNPEPVKPEPITHPTGCEHYRQLISQYNWNVNVMLQIASAESGCNPYAVGDTWTINGLYAPSCGLFQVRTLAGRPDCESLKDPATNIAWAYKIYMGQGYPAWSVCRTKVSCW